jgi:hypothetical protein
MPNPVDLEPQAKAVVDANANPPYLFELGPDQGRRTIDAVQSGPVKKLTSTSTGLGAFAWRMEPSTGGAAGLERAPPRGASPRLDLAPWWVRVWYQLPFIDRYAHAWMWRHGAWEVRPPEMELGHSGGMD